MIVDVRTDGSVALLEAEDTRAFKLVAPHGMTEADLSQVLTGVAEIESNHAWVKQSWILGNSPLAASQDWQALFAKMLDYARSKNWLHGADEAIRAHIEQK